ncbi:hypothetical protein DPMN_032332 [Dreissena polymorpha]|uniref:Uncharacterized protein n=1 Tax=Dreissena polymorpha TaxID=45954 RepID=A0A9D4M6D1_DREPO|nr:hypothetical protein DPMN_032332 [Dreissena polymorpha]
MATTSRRRDKSLNADSLNGSNGSNGSEWVPMAPNGSQWLLSAYFDEVFLPIS